MTRIIFDLKDLDRHVILHLRGNATSTLSPRSNNGMAMSTCMYPTARHGKSEQTSNRTLAHLWILITECPPFSMPEPTAKFLVVLDFRKAILWLRRYAHGLISQHGRRGMKTSECLR
jgi:hypothetical protein